MGAKKGRCAAVIAAGLLMASCMAPPACGHRSRWTMADHYYFSVRLRGTLAVPIDVYRDHLPPDVVFRQTSWDPSSEEFRATFSDGSWLRISAGPCEYDELDLGSTRPPCSSRTPSAGPCEYDEGDLCVASVWAEP